MSIFKMTGNKELPLEL